MTELELKEEFQLLIEVATGNTEIVAQLRIYLVNGNELKGGYIGHNKHWIQIQHITGSGPLQIMWNQVVSFIIT